MIVTGDVFTHTWDLARATGQSEALDPDQLQRMIAGVGAMPEEVFALTGCSDRASMFQPALTTRPGFWATWAVGRSGASSRQQWLARKYRRETIRVGAGCYLLVVRILWGVSR